MNDNKRIAVVPNLTKNGAYETSLDVITLLQQYGVEVMMTEDTKEKYKDMNIFFFSDHEKLVSACDVVLTIGGDGTIIHIAKHVAAHKKKLLGINMGRLGFVAGLEANELNMLKRVISGDYTIEKRMMLYITHIGKNGVTQMYALNDAIISRGSLSRLIDIDVSLGKGYICNYRADGLIISTPTGSSAYSLSAGGPVVEPTMKCILMTPICSHSLFARPVVFDYSSELVVSASCDDNTEIFLTVDGEKTITLEPDDKVIITSAKTVTEFINLKDKTFYKILNDKFAEKDDEYENTAPGKNS